MSNGIASGVLNVFYDYLQSQKSRNLVVRDPATGVEVLARDYFEVIRLRRNHSITQIRPEFMPEYMEKVYSKRARHHASSDVNFIFSEELDIDSLDGLISEKGVHFEKYQDQLWLEYIVDSTCILSIHRDCRRTKVYGFEQKTPKGQTYFPHPAALQIIDMIYESMEQRRLARQQEIKEAESAQRRTIVLTSHELGFQDRLPKQMKKPG